MVDNAACLEQTFSSSKDAKSKPAPSQVEKYTALARIIREEQNLSKIKREYCEWYAGAVDRNDRNTFIVAQKEVISMLDWLCKRNYVSKREQISPGSGPLHSEIYYNLKVSFETLNDIVTKTFSS